MSMVIVVTDAGRGLGTEAQELLAQAQASRKLGDNLAPR